MIGEDAVLASMQVPSVSSEEESTIKEVVVVLQSIEEFLAMMLPKTAIDPGSDKPTTPFGLL